MAKKGLGRGLGAIFGDDTVAAVSERRQIKKSVSGANAASAKKLKEKAEHVVKSSAEPQKEYVELPVTNVDNSDAENVSRETSRILLSLIEPDQNQPRKNFDEESMAELAESIKEHGVLQPIIVRKNGQMYKIVVGERRWRAARIAGLKDIPAIIKDLDDKEKAEIALIENIQREDLSSIEEAKAFRSLIEDYGLTQEELAKRVSKNRTTITNSLRLLQLDDEILDMVENGELSAGHARAILSINGKKMQIKAAHEIADRGLSVRQAEKLAKLYNMKPSPKKEKEKNIYIDAIANELTESMRLKVNIKQKSKTSGKVEIEYTSDEELEQIIDRIRSQQ